MHLYAIILIVIAVLLPAEHTSNTPFAEDDERERSEYRQSGFFAAVSDRNANRTAEYFDESAVLHIANRPPIEGRNAIRQFYARMFEFLSASIATPETTKISASGDMAYSYGRMTNEFSSPQGPMEYTGKYVLVWERSDDKWMIVFYGISSDQPGPGG